MSIADDYFDVLYQGNDDPWAMRQRWYEQRKRALLLACLPRARYGSVFEPGCANGETSAGLAQRCDSLLCSDMAEAAVTLTRQRVEGFAHVRVSQGRQPHEWPDERFDLIVLNELCYYLDNQSLDQLIERARNSLNAGGQLLACHWRAPIEGCELDAAQVHQRLSERLQMPRLVHHEESDFVLDLWSLDPMSVAQREGLR